jgi:hypothetical protein
MSTGFGSDPEQPRSGRAAAKHVDSNASFIVQGR